MKKKVFCLLVLSVLLASCGKRIPDQETDRREKIMRKIASSAAQEIKKSHIEKKDAFLKYFDSLSIEEKISQLFIENIEGDTVYVPVEKTGVLYGKKGAGRALVPGGYLFFGFNLADSPEGIMAFTDSIRSYCEKNNIVPPFLAIDQEGGYVNRLKVVAGPLPSQKRIAEKLSVEQAYRFYGTQARQMKALGFDMNLAPVVEVCTADNEKFLNGRSFGDTHKVLLYGTACVNAYENKGIGTVIKHFPGNTNTDPHTGLPEITLPPAELENMIRPFYGIVRAQPKGVLMSHARTSAIDSDAPACFSKTWVTQKLRNEMNYDGIIFSDDIFMGALADNGYPPEEAAIRAIEAGVDCIMISEKRFGGPAKVILEKFSEDTAFADKVNRAAIRVLSYKIRHGIIDFAEDSEGKLVVLAGNKLRSNMNRLEEFNRARKENIEMYIEYID